MPTVGHPRPPPPLPPVRHHTLPLPPPPPLLCPRLCPRRSPDLRHRGQVPLRLRRHLLPLLAPLPPSRRPTLLWAVSPQEPQNLAQFREPKVHGGSPF